MSWKPSNDVAPSAFFDCLYDENGSEGMEEEADLDLDMADEGNVEEEFLDHEFDVGVEVEIGEVEFDDDLRAWRVDQPSNPVDGSPPASSPRLPSGGEVEFDDDLRAWRVDQPSNPVDGSPLASSPRLPSGAVLPATRPSTSNPPASPSPPMDEQPHQIPNPPASPSPPNMDEPPHQDDVPAVFANARGRGASVRGGRGGGRAGRGSRRVPATMTWCSGDPLREMYVCDEDVPDDLRAAIMTVYERRRLAQQRLAARRRAARVDVDEDEFFDADDGRDAALFVGEESALNFNWRPMDSFQGVREEFLPQQTGPTVSSENALEAFRHYWDDEVLSHIVSETNRYAAIRSIADWYDTNIHELLVLFAFWVMLGIIRMPTIKSCFTTEPLLYTSCFRKMFSSSRYVKLCKALHFNGPALGNTSKTFALDPIISHLNSKFQSCYIPRQEICIDESLTLWKGNLSFRQYIKTKAAKFGIKTFELCESATGYLWSFFVYIGKDSVPDPTLPASLLKSTATVLRLVRPLLNKGYTLFMDNWFNSPLLTRYLKRNKTDVVGSMRVNRQHLPALITQCKLQPGQFTARHSGDMTIMAYHDKKKITLVSTYHGTEQAQPSPKPYRATPWKPQLVLDYNASMGGVDLKDGMLESHLLERKKCQKWNLKLFKRLLNVSILNSRICREHIIGKRVNHTLFRLELVDQILKSCLSLVPKPRQPPQPPPSDSHLTTNMHWPSTITKRSGDGRVARRKCKICKRQTSSCCSECDVGLCVESCFGKYHNK